MLLKWKDERGQEQKFCLVDIISADWKRFGTLLDISRNQLRGWEMKNLGNSVPCMEDVLETWLSGECTSDYPVSWEGLYTLLKDGKKSAIADNLRNAVSKCSVSL